MIKYNKMNNREEQLLSKLKRKKNETPSTKVSRDHGFGSALRPLNREFPGVLRAAENIDIF
jgi:hypothetical protein